MLLAEIPGPRFRSLETGFPEQTATLWDAETTRALRAMGRPRQDRAVTNMNSR